MIGRRIGVLTAQGAGLVTLLALGGCANVMSGVYGDAEVTPAPTTTTTVSAGPTRVDMDPDAECPQINVPAGTSSWSSTKGSASPRYQAVLGQFARECVLNPGNDVTIRIGVEGRILLGEGGGSGTYTAPLRIAVRDRAGNYVYNQVRHVTVTVPPGDTQGTFKIVDDSPHVSIGQMSPLAGYDIQISFGGGDAAAASPRKKKRRV